MLTYSPAQRNTTGLDPVNPDLTAGEVQHQLAVLQFLGIPEAERRGSSDAALTWQRNRVELLVLRLLELDAEPLEVPPKTLLPLITHAQREAVPAPAVPETPETPAYDPWAELERRVLAVCPKRRS